MEKITNYDVSNEKLSFKEKIGFFFTALASDTSGQFTSSFLSFFYTTFVFGNDIGIVSTVLGFSVIWDAINDPIIANIVDNNPSNKGERLRPILLWWSIPFAFCFLMLFTFPFPTSMSDGLKMLWCFGWYFIYMIPKTFYYLPVYTLRQVATANNDERLKLNAFISYGQAFGSALPTTLIVIIINMVANKHTIETVVDGELKNVAVYDNPFKGYFVGALVVAILIIFASFYNYFTTKERVINNNKEKTPILKAMKMVIKDKNFLYNLGLFFFYGLVVTLATGYAMYYCTYVLLDKPVFGIDPVVFVSAFFILGTLLATPFVRTMYNKFGRTKTTIIGTLFLLVGAILFIIFAENVIGGCILTFAIGIGTAITIIVIGMNRADVTDVIEYKNNHRMDGMVNNVSSLIQKIARSVVTIGLGWILEFAGFKINPYGKSSVTAIILVMGIGVIISAILMIVFSLRITLDKEMAQMKAEKEGNK